MNKEKLVSGLLKHKEELEKDCVVDVDVMVENILYRKNNDVDLFLAQEILSDINRVIIPQNDN